MQTASHEAETALFRPFFEEHEALLPGCVTGQEPTVDYWQSGAYSMTLAERNQALDLLGRLDAGQRAMALRFMEFLLLPPAIRSAATAPLDDEPCVEGDLERARAGDAISSSDAIGMEDLLEEFGFKIEDFPQAR
ncbi:MAG: hypothetical protein KJZ84_04615 [Bryobacteraceae bacterium]|nr:hypothetical protein [Bryobacteraceae bacterium]